MPFTFSHPALILPLLRLRKVNYSLTGLIVGSITPDFEYFIKLKKGYSSFSHSIPSLFYFNLPIGLLLALVFHSLVRVPLINNLPQALYSRLANYKGVAWKNLFQYQMLTLVWCLLLGSSLHLLWDWVTHQNADLFFRGVKSLALPNKINHNMVYTATHVLHSVLGLAFIIVRGRQIPPIFPEDKRRPIAKFWIWVAGFASSFFLVRLFVGDHLRGEDLIASAMSALLSGILISCLVNR